MNNIELKEGAKLSPFLKNVIFETARKHPDWTFRSGAPEVTQKITVLEKDGTTQLGVISMEKKYVRGDAHFVFVIDNWRINEMRQRGSGIQTAKPKEALKAIEKYFYPLTDPEQIHDSFKHAYHLVHSEASNAQRNVDASIRALYEPTLAYARSRWEDFISTLNEKERMEALNLLKHQQLCNEAKALFSDVDSKNRLTVFLTNGKYVVQQGEVLQEYESDTLPEHIKTKVGMLKLVEEKQVIPEIGVRVGKLYVIKS